MNKVTTKQPENNYQNTHSKSIPFNNYFKCKWTKLYNQNSY